jgi:diguanylate cyclase (GGDEF)-like protein
MKTTLITSRVFYIGVIFFLLTGNANSNNSIETLLEQANQNRSSNPTKYSELLEQLKHQDESMSPQQRYYLDYLSAYQLIYKGDNQKAKVNLLNILSSSADKHIKFRSRLTLVNVFAIEQNWGQGLTHLSTALKQLPDITDKNEAKEEGLAVAAIFYNQLGQYNLGLTYANKLKNKATTKRSRCIASMSLIESKLYLNKLKDSSLEIQEAITLCEGEPIAENFIRSNKAKYSIANNNFSNVESLLVPHLSKIEATKYPRLIVETYSTLAQAYLMQNKLDAASKFATKSIKVGKRIKTTQAVVLAHKIIYQIHQKQSNYQQALSYHKEFSKLDKAYIDETKAKHLAFQLAEHKSLEQETQIKLLNEKNNALAAEQALAKTQATNKKLIILSLTLIIFVFAFLGLRFYHAHKRVKGLAEYDPLTGAFNRGHFNHVAEDALQYCKNTRQDLSLIVFDLDYFKNVNDTFGHGCGDWALKETIKVCKEIGRKNDIFARLGGEEFCIVLPGCNIEAARLHAEACRAAIEAIDTKESTHEFHITASFGVTDVKLSGFNLDILLANADMAAYASKNSGRNLVTLHQAS